MRITDYASGLQYIGISTEDMMESMIFYTELGFDVVHTNQNPETGEIVNFLQLGNLIIELYETQDPRMETGSIDHIAIAASDIEGAYHFICSRGINTLNDEIHSLPYLENGIKYFTIQGPNKERIKFVQRL